MRDAHHLAQALVRQRTEERAHRGLGQDARKDVDDAPDEPYTLERGAEKIGCGRALGKETGRIIGGERNAQEGFQGLAVVVGRIFEEIVERVPEAGLPKHLERRACHPAVDVHLLSSAILGQTLRNRCLDLTQCLVAEQDHI